MNTVKITIFQCEGTSEQIATVLQGAMPLFGGGVTLLGEPIRGELLSTELEPSVSEAPRAARAKPRAQPEATPKTRTKSRAVPLKEYLASKGLEDEPAAPKARAGGEESMVDRVVAAFAKDNNYPLPKLCEKLYGDSSGKNLAKLKQIVHYACTTGKLKRIGAAAYSVVSE